MSVSDARGRYLLGDSPAEIRHLVAQAEVYAHEAGELFDLIGVPAGISAIDMGCGVMGVVHLLAERIGAGGRVVGLDFQGAMVEMARRFAEERGLDVEFVEADATTCGLPDAGFDLVHARTLLVNVAEPERIVAEMMRIARPGGVVAVQEPDGGAWVCDPPHPAWDALCSGVVNAYRHTGKDFTIGRRVARILLDAGLSDVRVRATARVTAPGEYYHTFLPTVAGLVRDVMVRSGDLTAGEFDAHAEALRAHLEVPGTITCQPLMWQAWGRVPG